MQKRLHARVRAVYIWLMAPLLRAVLSLLPAKPSKTAKLLAHFRLVGSSAPSEYFNTPQSALRLRTKTALKPAIRGLAVFAIFVFGALVVTGTPQKAQAATSSNLNFQARLLTNTGAVVPDGNYNIVFKLYDQDGSTGPNNENCTSNAHCLWTEVRKNSNSQGVQVINGYFSVNLGSVTSFPNTINWDQQLWLTMNIGGTTTGASPTWDGEMQNAGHSIALTALPYAFTAGSLASGTGASRGTLSFASLGQATTITLPDPGGASATICYQGSSSCNFINNSAGGPQTANFNIQSAAVGSIGGIISGASGQTADLFELKNSSIVFSVGNNGQTLFKPTATNDSVTFFQIQPAGSTTPVFNVDTTNSRVGIGSNAPGAALHVITTTASTVGLIVQGDTNGSANLQQWKTNGGALLAAMVNQSGQGNLSFYGSTASYSFFNIYNTNNIAGQQGYRWSFDNNRLTFQSTTDAGLFQSNQVAIYQASGDMTVGNDSGGGMTDRARLTVKGKDSTSSNTALDVRNFSDANLINARNDGLIVIGGTASTATISLGQSTAGETVNIANGTVATTKTNTINIGTSATGTGKEVITIGSTNDASSLALKSGSGGINLTPSGASNTGVLVKPGADSTTALQVQKAASSNVVMAVDTTNNQLVLGTAGTSGFNGKLVFSTTNASNTTITLQSASTATSYVLTLPTTGPALGQCLQNDGTTVGQLTFGACGASGTFVNFAPSSVQADSSTNNSIFINKTGASGNILELQKNGSDVFTVDNSGNVTTGASNTFNSNTFTSSNLTFGAASAATVQAASNQALNFTSNATSIWQVAGANQNLTIQTSGTGTLALDTVGGGTVNVGATNAATINIGNNNTTALTIGGVSLNGTVTTKALGILRTLTGSATAPSDVIKTTTNSSGAFQVQNTNSNRVLGVDTSLAQVLLGQSSALDGALVFQNSSNSHAITLNSTGANNDYTLTLPAQAPSGGLCIQTSTGNASQLVFASCANNNTSISEVAAWDSNNSTTLPISPSAVGDEMVLTTQIPSSGVTVTGISGGGVTNWSKVTTSAGNGTVNRVELWVGTVSTVGSSTVTVTYSAAPGANEITATEFTAAGVNQSTSWGVESFSSQLNSTASTTVTYPNLTAVNGAELYYGYAQVQNPPATSNGTTGFNYIQTSTQHNMVTYNPSLTANTAYQPTALQNSSGQSNTVSAILTAFVTSTAINNSTSLQKANFYVQAANAGSVAGVLQAASSGSADILNLRNSGGSNVMTVSSTGDVAIKSTGSTTAFQVQNNSNYSVMSVDTTGNQLILGDATHLSGKITFKDSTDSNTISILAPSAVAATYSLTLPTNTPTAGLCLGTSPSNANQLIFASCATQVSAASITYINQWSNNGTSITTLADSPAATGNLLVLFSHGTNNVSITGVSGGGVTNWTKVTSNVGAAGMGNNEMWRGVVTATGSATITVTYSAAAGANEIVAQEYTMGGTGGGTWAIDTSGTTTGTNATVNYPSLTPASSSELYAGYAWSANTMSAGSTSGYTYAATSGGKYTARNTNVTGGVAQQPTASQSVSGNYNSIAALIQAFAGTSVIVNSTATQQANFNVQAALSGTVAGVLQGASSGTADILQVKDGSGNNVMSVNGSSGVTLGTSTVASGTLVFNASGNSNTITITAPATPGTSYSLKLPSAQAAPGQCLAASPSDNTQLVFSSCANQVTSVAISYVNGWNTSGNGVTTLNVSPANVNDMMVFFSSPRGGGSITNVTGGGVSVWSKITSTTAGSGADTSSIDMWKGVVTTTGASTVTVTFSGSSGNPNELAAMEFTTGSTTGSWVVDASNTQYNGTSSTTMTFPSLTPQSSRDLYVGYGSSGSAYSSGSSAGFTYLSGALTNRVGLYNTSISAATQPTATTSGSSTSLTVGALIAAYSSSSVISNSTVTQQANFNIQAATSTSVAGVLQAFPGSSSDVLQIMDGSGAVVDSFGSTGNLLVKPSTASAAAFQVQTTGSVNVLSVDTSGSQVVIGAGSTGEASISVLVLDNKTGSSADPATAVNGAMYYNAVTHTFRCAAAGAWQNCAGLLYSNTSKSSASSNCSNNCAAFSTVAPIPANYCQAGKIIRLSANGYFSSQATASNIQFGVYYGTDSATAANDVLIGTVSPAVSVTSASNNYFQLNLDINCFSTTSMQAGGVLSIQAGAASAGLTSVPMNATNAATVVTSSAKNLYIFPIWSAASLSNTATLAQFGVNTP